MAVFRLTIAPTPHHTLVGQGYGRTIPLPGVYLVFAPWLTNCRCFARLLRFWLSATSARLIRREFRARVSTSAPRSSGNLHELLHLLGGEGRGNEFPRHGVGHDLIDALDSVDGEAFLRNEIAHAQDDLLRQAGIFGIDLERRRIGIHPGDRLLIGAVEAHDSV